MKHWILLLGLAVALTGFTTACSAKHKVDASRLQTSFGDVADPAKTLVNQAVAAINKGDYTLALSSMTQLADRANLTKPQKQAIADTLVDIQVIVSENPPANAEELFKAIEELSTKVM
jgi:hypothetical protein